jgi:hypothetical protein
MIASLASFPHPGAGRTDQAGFSAGALAAPAHGVLCNDYESLHALFQLDRGASTRHLSGCASVVVRFA